MTFVTSDDPAGETKPVGSIGNVSDQEKLFGAERAKAFIDAVVAIAMTLLILPLMESVADAAGKGEDAGAWATSHLGQLFAFVLSFVMIAMFWINHHRVFLRVERITTPLLWLTIAWLLSIVWLPVVTAMVGQMPSGDRVLIAMYIGSLILTTVLALAAIVYLRAHPATHSGDGDYLLRWIAANLAMTALFTAAFVIGVVFVSVSYFALFLMFLMRPTQLLFSRALGVGRSAPAPTDG